MKLQQGNVLTHIRAYWVVLGRRMPRAENRQSWWASLQIQVVSQGLHSPCELRHEPAGVNIKGNNENTPETDASVNVRKYALFSAASKLMQSEPDGNDDCLLAHTWGVQEQVEWPFHAHAIQTWKKCIHTASMPWRTTYTLVSSTIWPDIPRNDSKYTMTIP